MDISEKITNSEELKAIKAAKAAYQKKWRKDNPEKHEAIMNRHWLKKAKEIGLF